MNIAVYSGSFNPLHIGHLAIMKHLIEKAGFDMVYLVVSPKNPLKDSISSDSGHERYLAAIEAVNRHVSTSSPEAEDYAEAKIKVDDIELNMPEPHYSIRTLRALQEREPQNTFTLVMGADNLAGIRRWKEYRQILADFGTAVFPREGFDLTKIRQDLLDEGPEYRIRLLDAPLVTVSSTEIRNALSQGKDISHLLM
jgi:nicotinate-nucleotide adenylyltransferase